MKIIDSHQHFWKFNTSMNGWITDDMVRIRKDFLPVDLATILTDNKISGCVAVQADQSEAETAFLLSCANEYDFIKGVVGWVDLQDNNLKERLDYYSHYKKLKGFRNILQSEPQRDLMLNDTFTRGIELLGIFKFTYDILILPDQLPFASQLAAKFPQQKFVIDHIAKPNIKRGKMDEWKKDIEAVSQCINVYCKVSGVVTEANWKNWKKEDFYPYFDVVMNAFGADRLMFGSDWPVCLIAAEYKEVLEIAADFFSTCSIEEKNKIFGSNAIEFYNLK